VRRLVISSALSSLSRPAYDSFPANHSVTLRVCLSSNSRQFNLFPVRVELMAAATALPVLLPQKAILSPEVSPFEWRPTRDFSIPLPPPPDDSRTQDQEIAMARQAMDGKPVKKVRPRRTVDYGGSIGRWALMRKLRPNSTYVPYLRPAPPFIIDVR